MAIRQSPLSVQTKRGRLKPHSGGKVAERNEPVNVFRVRFFVLSAESC